MVLYSKVNSSKSPYVTKHHVRDTNEEMYNGREKVISSGVIYINGLLKHNTQHIHNLITVYKLTADYITDSDKSLISVHSVQPTKIFRLKLSFVGLPDTLFTEALSIEQGIKTQITTEPCLHNTADSVENRRLPVYLINISDGYSGFDKITVCYLIFVSDQFK